MEIKDLINPDLNLSDFPDKDLYHLCQQYGAGIRMLRRIFAVLLVEVNRRRLHRKHGFESIYMFAAKVGGMNKELVNQILWLAEFLKDKPYLWRQFRIDGWSKVRVVASIATVETDKLWAEKVNILSKPALEELVRYLKKKNLAESEQKQLCNNLFNFAKNDEDIEQSGNFDQIGNSKNSENPEKSENSKGFKKSTDVHKSVLNNFPKNSQENVDSAFLQPKNDMVPNSGEVNSENTNHDKSADVLGKPDPNAWIFGQNGTVGDEPFVKMRFKVSQETEFKFLLFKQRLCKKKKEALTSGEVLGILLDGVEFKRI